jgi:hypothetical protein
MSQNWAAGARWDEESGLQACYGKSPGNGAFSIDPIRRRLVRLAPRRARLRSPWTARRGRPTWPPGRAGYEALRDANANTVSAGPRRSNAMVALVCSDGAAYPTCDSSSSDRIQARLSLQLEELLVQRLSGRGGNRPELFAQEAAEAVIDQERIGVIPLCGEHLHQQPVATFAVRR